MKLVHLVGFITKKFVTMQHGHMSVKKTKIQHCVKSPKELRSHGGFHLSASQNTAAESIKAEKRLASPLVTFSINF